MNTSNHAFPAYNWNLIKSFLAVLDEGTLSGAARKLGISQPTLSRHMDELEEELNLTLFERGRRGALPTSAAYAIADHASDSKSHRGTFFIGGWKVGKLEGDSSNYRKSDCFKLCASRYYESFIG